VLEIEGDNLKACKRNKRPLGLNFTFLSSVG
jgi:hypothetical protein